MQPLYVTLLGSSFHALSPILQRIHDDRARKRYAGRCAVERGTGRLARALAALVGLPKPHHDTPVEVTIERRGDIETWTRRFGSQAMRSVLRARDRVLEERLGLVTLRFELVATEESILWAIKGARFLCLPLPVSFFSACTARESIDGDRYRFDVHAEMRGVGLLVRYRGWMTEHV
jgi:hypothetical protein